GGNLPEGSGIPQDLTMARLLELYADERRGPHLEVLNAPTGGWALDNSLAFFRGEGASRDPISSSGGSTPWPARSPFRPGPWPRSVAECPRSRTSRSSRDAQSRFLPLRSPPGGAGDGPEHPDVVGALPPAGARSGTGRATDGLGGGGHLSPRHAGRGARAQ